MKNNIFKYGEPYENKIIQSNTRNALYVATIESSVQDLINNNVDIRINSNVENIITNNISNIIQNTDIVNNISSDITNNIINNIDIPPDININSISLYTTTNDRFIINDNTFVDGNLIISVDSSPNFNDLSIYTNYGLITDKKIYLKNELILNDNILKVIDNNLYFNNEKLNGSNIFTIDDINNTITTNYDFIVNGNTNINNDLSVSGNINMSDNTISVIDNNLYFNNRLISCCDYKGKYFHLCFDYNTINLLELENEIKKVLHANNINTTYIKFTFDDIIKITMNLRNDICLNPQYQEEVINNIENAYELIVNGNIYITIDGVTRQAIPHIYYLNTYYYFNDLSKNNSFKLVKRYDENNNKALLDGMEVFFININGEYLQKDFTFNTSNSNNLLLKVHAYTNMFLTENKDCFINIEDGFKLEYLPGMMIYENCYYPSGLPSLCDINVIFGDTYDENTFEQDTTWTNIGINPSNLTEEIFLSTNIEDYIENPILYDNIFLIDQRWITVNEDNGIVTYNYTYNNNHIDSKKFVNGYDFCNTQNIPDYVFHNTYNLESIENHGKFMFTNKHLPALKSSKYYNNNNNYNNLLEELEKAHIYIYQLNEKIKKLESVINI